MTMAEFIRYNKFENVQRDRGKFWRTSFVACKFFLKIPTNNGVAMLSQIVEWVFSQDVYFNFNSVQCALVLEDYAPALRCGFVSRKKGASSIGEEKKEGKKRKKGRKERREEKKEGKKRKKGRKERREEKKEGKKRKKGRKERREEKKEGKKRKKGRKERREEKKEGKKRKKGRKESNTMYRTTETIEYTNLLCRDGRTGDMLNTHRLWHSSSRSTMNACHALSLFKASSAWGQRARQTVNTSIASPHTDMSSWSASGWVAPSGGGVGAALTFAFSWAQCISSLVEWTRQRAPLLAAHAIFWTARTVFRSGKVSVACNRPVHLGCHRQSYRSVVIKQSPQDTITNF